MDAVSSPWNTINAADDPKTSPTDLTMMFYVTPSLVRHGRINAALHLMKRSSEANVIPYDFLLMNPDFKKLRGNPEFEETLVSGRKQFDEMLIVVNQARAKGEFPKYLEKPLDDLLIKLKEQERQP
jgi:hypothetical protein